MEKIIITNPLKPGKKLYVGYINNNIFFRDIDIPGDVYFLPEEAVSILMQKDVRSIYFIIKNKIIHGIRCSDFWRRSEHTEVMGKPYRLIRSVYCTIVGEANNDEKRE